MQEADDFIDDVDVGIELHTEPVENSDHRVHVEVATLGDVALAASNDARSAGRNIQSIIDRRRNSVSSSVGVWPLPIAWKMSPVESRIPVTVSL